MPIFYCSVNLQNDRCSSIEHAGLIRLKTTTLCGLTDDLLSVDIVLTFAQEGFQNLSDQLESTVQSRATLNSMLGDLKEVGHVLWL